MDSSRRPLGSHMLTAAVDALGQSYDYLVVDAGAQSDIAVEPILQFARRAVLVAGETPAPAAAALRDQLLSAGFADVTLLLGPPPPLDHAVSRSAAA